MHLDITRITERLQQNEFIKKFLRELSIALENNELKGNKMEDIKLTPKEDLELYRKESNFLQEYFKKELSNFGKGEIFIVTNKYENESQYHRYKVAQYKNNLEYKFIAFEKDLPKNIQLGDVVRKIGEKYVYDMEATQYVNEEKRKIKEEIIKNRK